MIRKNWLDVWLLGDTDWTGLVSKTRFPSRFQDSYHSRHLNSTLDVGIGRWAPRAFGFSNERQENDE